MHFFHVFYASGEHELGLSINLLKKRIRFIDGALLLDLMIEIE